jgi:phosphatidylserine decarboxylase
MAKPVPLPVWDRKSGKLTEEFLDDLASTYESKPQRSPVQWLESEPLYDWIVSAFQNTRWSARKIQPFIDKHKIDMSEFEPVIYRSYAQFFTRKFRAGVRTITSKPGEMAAFAEARYFGWPKLEPQQRFPIKSHSLDAELLLGTAERSRRFLGGPVLMARLAPVDYHHVHYPDDGRTLDHYRLGRRLWTVNWPALQNKDDILFKNERCIHMLDTANFGRLAFVEIGAMTVGRIVQVHPLDVPFERGAEKSFFCFGGSAIVVFGEAGAWRPSDDIVENTSHNTETRVLLGEPIANSARTN